MSGGQALTDSDERILVVDDEPAISDLAASALRFSGFDVQVASSGREALSVAAGYPPRLVILDATLPDIDAAKVVRNLRSTSNLVAAIYLTSANGDQGNPGGLAVGADDYLAKPFSLDELLARVRAGLRRSSPDAGPASRLVYADLELDEEGYQVWRGGERVHLSPTEFRLLRYLLLNAERALSKNEILANVWPYDFTGAPGVVENYVSYLRRKLDHGKPTLIQTVRGFGYALRTEAEYRASGPV